MSKFADKVNKLKNKMGLKNIDLAKYAGIPNTTLADILHGKTERISYTTVKALADVLGCSVEYLMSDEDLPSARERASDEFFLLKEEAELISIYRRLDYRGKEALMKLARQQEEHCKASVDVNDDEWKHYIGTVTAARGGLRLIDENDAKEIAKIKKTFLLE